VPFDDESNNARMVYEHLLNKVDIPANQVFIMRTDLTPRDAANDYEAILKKYFKDKPQTFNLVLLGMGDDGHTLSLFPGTDVVHETEKWVSEVLLNDAGQYRITLTAPVVNLASKVVFLVAGEGKANTLNKVLNGPSQPVKYPSQLIKPASDNLYWFVDAAAAGKLPNNSES
jgi:6-phosphogluconolactonase